ncbi:Succinyl-diaminopimelate desuccinylase [Streptomyces hirsutus]
MSPGSPTCCRAPRNGSAALVDGEVHFKADDAAGAGLDARLSQALINQAHWTMRNLLLERLDERAEMLTGRHKSLSMVEGVQHGDVDGIAFIGYHAGAGMEGVLAHTFLANSITGVWLNGERASEGLLNAAVVAEYGVPVVLVTGDDVACEDALGYAPGALKVAVKDHVSRYAAVCRTPARTASDIRAAAKDAAALAVRHEPVAAGPFSVAVEFDAEHLAMAATVVPGVARTGERKVAYTSGTMYDGSAPSRRSPRSPRLRWRSSMADEHALDEVVTFTSDLIRIDTTNRGAAVTAGSGPPPSTRRSGWPERAWNRCCSSAPPAGPTSSRASRAPTRRPTRSSSTVTSTSYRPRRPTGSAIFSGEVRDGVVWGRGAVDMKNMDAMILAVVRAWARQGVRPRRDIVIAFTADEEASAEDGSGFLADRHPELFEGCTEGISESGCLHRPRRLRPATLSDRRGRTRHGLAEAHRARTGRPRLQGQPGQRGDPPRRRRRPHRRARSGRCG